MILIEYEIEKALRTAIRASLTAYGIVTPALIGAKIVTYWHGAEDESAGNDASNLRVMIAAAPSSSPGWLTGAGLESRRTVAVDVYCVSMPDSDEDRTTALRLYEAVRSVFETHGQFSLATGITFGGLLITNGGTAEIQDIGQVTSFTVEMKVSI